MLHFARAMIIFICVIYYLFLKDILIFYHAYRNYDEIQSTF